MPCETHTLGHIPQMERVLGAGEPKDDEYPWHNSKAGKIKWDNLSKTSGTQQDFNPWSHSWYL